MFHALALPVILTCRAKRIAKRYHFTVTLAKLEIVDDRLFHLGLYEYFSIYISCWNFDREVK